MIGEVADLRDANLAHQKRIAAMAREVEQLRDALRDSQERATTKLADFATRDDLKKIVEQIKEVDQQREADKKLILQEFANFGKEVAASTKAAQKQRQREQEQERERERERERNSEPEKPIEGTFLEYVVREGDGSLSEIQSNYNAELQKQGRPAVTLKQILQANPKLNPNRIFVGQKLQLPVPDKKK